MTTIRLCCHGAAARVTVSGDITAGAVGIPVIAEYDSAWDHLAKKIVFATQLEARSAAEFDGVSTVPWELLEPGLKLRIGVVGRDAEGKTVIPTIWADCGTVKASPVEADAADAEPAPTPSMVEQLLAQVEQLRAEVGNNGSTGGTGGVTVTNRVEVGNMNAVTSNAVAVLCGDIEAILGAI